MHGRLDGVGGIEEFFHHVGCEVNYSVNYIVEFLGINIFSRDLYQAQSWFPGQFAILRQFL